MYFKEEESEINDVTPAFKYALALLVAIVFIIGSILPLLRIGCTFNGGIIVLLY